MMCHVRQVTNIPTIATPLLTPTIAAMAYVAVESDEVSSFTISFSNATEQFNST